jgi:hypothetical protein
VLIDGPSLDAPVRSMARRELEKEGELLAEEHLHPHGLA